eukprot:GHVU01182406.1.p1 GENE.GHVU01182406.1~~GHVU01182406.1.p1  ORF type:complete len:414 (-),score=38.05 GHVU01182406.1:63-1304(-)
MSVISPYEGSEEREIFDEVCDVPTDDLVFPVCGKYENEQPLGLFNLPEPDQVIPLDPLHSLPPTLPLTSDLPARLAATRPMSVSTEQNREARECTRLDRLDVVFRGGDASANLAVSATTKGGASGESVMPSSAVGAWPLLNAPRTPSGMPSPRLYLDSTRGGLLGRSGASCSGLRRYFPHCQREAAANLERNPVDVRPQVDTSTVLLSRLSHLFTSWFPSNTRLVVVSWSSLVHQYSRAVLDTLPWRLDYFDQSNSSSGGNSSAGGAMSKAGRSSHNKPPIDRQASPINGFRLNAHSTIPVGREATTQTAGNDCRSIFLFRSSGNANDTCSASIGAAHDGNAPLPVPPQLSSSRRVLKGSQFPDRMAVYRFNFASADAGAKVVAASKGIHGVKEIQKPTPDTYMLAPCRQLSW